MKTNKIFSTVAAIAAMFTMGATQAQADDMYHASDVRYEVGVYTESNQLYKIGETADNCEIWAAPKTTDKYSYFYCYVDGVQLSVPNTSIDDNETHTLTELSWYQVPRLRQITSDSNNHTIFVKVKSNKSGDNKLMVWDRDLEKKISDRSDWYLTGENVTIQPQGEPVYDASTDTYTQEIKWDTENISSRLWWGTEIYALIDDSEKWECVGTTYAFNPSHTITVTLPGNAKRVTYGGQAVPYGEYAFVVNLDNWASAPSREYSLDKQAGAAGRTLLDEDGSETSGINGIDGNTDASQLVDIYTTNGVQVAQNAKLSEASSTLSRGIYVVNGKKMVLGR